MSSAEVKLFSRSTAFLSAWISDLKKAGVKAQGAAAAVPAAATVTAAAKPVAAAPAAAAPAAPAAAPAPAAAKPAPKHIPGQRRAKPEVVKDESTSMSKVNIIVGTVTEVAEHPEADGLWMEQIDCGEEKPRTILSGLRAHVTKEDFLGRQVVVVANLEPRKMRGIVSEGMVLCASDADKKKVRLLSVPAGVPNGERITFPGHEGDAEPVLKKKLAKHYDNVSGELFTDAAGVAVYGKAAPLTFNTTQGPVTCAEMPDSIVS